MDEVSNNSTQMGLLEEEEYAPNYLHIVKDGQKVNMTREAIFDSSTYYELLAVSFVSSPSFFLKAVDGFETVELIIGIEDNSVLTPFQNSIFGVIDPQQQVDFWKEIDEKARNKIRNHKIKVRYSKLKTSIHTKLYLMQGDTAKRVVLGSANFTENAFKNKKQFEELLILDDPESYKLYRQRYEEIKGFTIDYIPERLKRSKPNEVLILDSADLKKDIMLENVDKVSSAKLDVYEQEEIKVLPHRAELLKDNWVRLEKTIEVVTFKNRKSDSKSFQHSSKLAKKEASLKALVSRTRAESAKLDRRMELYYRDEDDKLYCPESRENSDTLVEYSRKEDNKTQLQKNLKALVRFVDAYKEFTAESDYDTCARVMEAILYAFTAPYLWKIRDHYSIEKGRKNARVIFPPFLFIAGRASSGKTTLLEMLGQLLADDSNYFSYEKIKGKNILVDYFQSENVMPVLVDEIAGTFFNSKAEHLGERLIKYVSGDLDGKHPVLIATTNATDFDVPGQVERRIYYLGINNTFDNSRETESNKLLTEVVNTLDTGLFQNYSFRFSALIRSGEPFYYEEDFLYGARKIFKELFQEMGIPLPEWFPHKKFLDYRNRGKIIWEELYDAHHEFFKEKESDDIFVDIDQFCRNQRDRVSKINYIPPECVKEDSHVLILSKSKFKEFIGRNERKTLLGSLKNLKQMFSRS